MIDIHIKEENGVFTVTGEGTYKGYPIHTTAQLLDLLEADGTTTWFYKDMLTQLKDMVNVHRGMRMEKWRARKWANPRPCFADVLEKGRTSRAEALAKMMGLTQS